ncbi:MAG: methyltransferase [Promethearchaeota archaeon]
MYTNSVGRLKIIKDPLIECDFEEVYYPSDDTYMLIDYFKQNVNEKYFDGNKLSEIKYLLDMGTGTGIIAIFFQLLKTRHKNFNPTIYASDISEHSLICAKKNEIRNNIEGQITFLQSDLFKNFPRNLKSIFNVIVFNPPYLPSLEIITENNEKTRINHSYDGGEIGFETIIRFLKNAIEFLNIENYHSIYFVSSSRTNLDELNKEIKKLGYLCELLGKRHIFFEDIILNRVRFLKS